jgi:hypothetical protein
MMGFGCAFLDYDRDGWLDILLVARDHVELYHNRQNGTFENVTARAFPGARAIPYLMGCSVCDYDGDGWPDLFITGYGRTILYHNQGDGTFKDVTRGSGLEAGGPYDWTTSATWTDVDGDGKPDLYVCRYVSFTPQDKQQCAYERIEGGKVMMACPPTAYHPEKGSLYRNIGGGHFVDITASVGLSTTHGNGLACRFCDLTGNGRPDLFIANDEMVQDLYQNLSHFKFKNVSAEAGVSFGGAGSVFAGMGFDCGDYDNDGKMDLIVSAFSSQPKCLFHNQGAGVFTDLGATAGISGPSLSALVFGANFIDYDNDGWLDVLFMNGHVQTQVELTDPTATYREAGMLFRNTGEGRFTDASGAAGPDLTRKIVARGVALGDFDNDGREDILVVDAEGVPLLLHNECHENHSITLRCFGLNGRSDALGARITVKANGMTQVREVRSGGTYLSADAPEVCIGIGKATTADEISVRWPDGTEHTYRSIAADHRYEISENSTASRMVH